MQVFPRPASALSALRPRTIRSNSSGCDGSFRNGDRSDSYDVATRAFNRYDYDLVEYDVHYRFFDVAHHLIYEQTWSYTRDLGGDELDVSPGDQTAASGFIPYLTVANMNIITGLDCKVVSAKFADSSTWKSAAPWHGKVYHSRPPSTSDASARAQDSVAAGGLAQTNYTKVAGLKATILATWHSLARGDQWVHIRFALGAMRTAVLRGSDFVATMNLAAGGTNSVRRHDAAVAARPQERQRVGTSERGRSGGRSVGRSRLARQRDGRTGRRRDSRSNVPRAGRVEPQQARGVHCDFGSSELKAS